MIESASQVLSPTEQSEFHRNGFCLARGAVSPAQLAGLNEELEKWVEESRQHPSAFGETYDERPRFDLEEGHNAQSPRLRRVNNPAEVSAIYHEVAFDAPMVDMVSTLIGPDVKFLHSKINLKLAHTETRVGFHQDFSYVPHTNPDVVTALLLLDDMTLENGCLMGVPGSHLEGQSTLWRGEVFTGEVDAKMTESCKQRAKPVTGQAGDVCLMHAELLHGSQPNRSSRPRGLYICMYSASDAFLLRPNSLPNRFEGSMVRGQPATHARLREGRVELPEDSHRASFFQLQSEHLND